MNRQDIFVTPIWNIDELPIDNSKLLEHALRLRDKEPTKRNPEQFQTARVYKWKSYNLTEIDYLAVPELKKLVDLVTSYVNQAAQEIDLRDTTSLKISDLWYNIYDKGVDLEGHIHPGNFLSATYYIKAQEDCGDLLFRTSNHTIYYQYNPKTISNRNNITAVAWNMKAIENRLVIHPSNVYHSVSSNQSNDQRVSITFNYQIVDSNRFPPNHRLFKQ